MNRKRFEEVDFIPYLEQLIKQYHLEVNPALGITKQVIDQGIESLSPKQMAVFEQQVIEKKSVEYCKWLECDIPWCEMIDALENGGYCNDCANQLEKNKID